MMEQSKLVVTAKVSLAIRSEVYRDHTRGRESGVSEETELSLQRTSSD